MMRKNSNFICFFGLLAICLALPVMGATTTAVAEAPSAPNDPKNPLHWDSVIKTYTAKIKDSTNQFFFTVTNTAKTPVTINEVQPSCGCTVAKLPSQPWTLQGGEHGTFSATVDFHGKFGKVQKTLLVVSTAGHQVLTVQVNVPVNEETQRREQNMEVARNDRQAVFKGDCAKCHVQPAMGKSGEALYAAACAICHDASNRGENVPDLHAINKRTYPKYWKYYLENGGPHMMPSFAKEKGGFLEDAQMDVFAEFLDKKFPTPKTLKPVSAK